MVHHKAQNVAARPRTEDIQVIDNTDFSSMCLPELIVEGMKKSHYVKPSPIQKKAIPLVRSGLDLIVQAKAGTGKTCVFTVAALEMVKPNQPHLQAVVLAPTREIALQITEVINAIGQAMPGLKTSCFIGGYPVSLDMKNAVGCHIAVGAPGRMRHLMDKGLLKPQYVRLFVLDEADKLMEQAFVDDINQIFSYLPEAKQVLACSATYTPELVGFLSCYMNHGQYVTPSNAVNTTVLLGIRQYVSVLSLHVDKLATLRLKERHLLYLLKSVSFDQCLVFSNLHSRAVSLCNMLRGEGWSAQWIAGRQDQADRVIAMSQLKEERVRVLVTTDLTARGIDIEKVNLIINLDLPKDHQTYLHRMGRAGRYGSHGIVITVVSAGDLVAFQKMLGAIGGTSQSVNCIPEVLKDIDLWDIAEEDLEKVYGIVEAPLTNSEAGTTEKTEDSTDTDEKFSQESSDEDDTQDQRNCNEKHVSEENICSCDLYEVELPNLETISNPSLFSVSKKEDHWQDVLPVTVYESKLPLNTPVALLGSKFIRVKSWDKMQKNTVDDNVNVDNMFVVDFESKCDDGDFLSFENVKCILEVEENFEIESRNDIWEVSNRANHEEIKQILVRYENKRKNSENAMLAFDSFDIVGWMAVDKTLDFEEDLKCEKWDVSDFELVKCPSGKNHIKIISSPTVLVERVNNSEEHVLAINLEEFKLTPPYSLGNIQKVIRECALKSCNKVTENGTVMNGKHDTTDKVTTESTTISLGEVKNNVKHTKKTHKPKQCNRKGAKDSSNFTSNDCKYSKTRSKKLTPHLMREKSVGSKTTKELNKKSGSTNSSEKSPSLQTQPLPYPKVIIDKKKGANCREVNSSSYDPHIAGLREQPISSKDRLCKKSVSSQSEYESDTSSSESELSEGALNLCAAPNERRRSLSVTSEESGPYVDMSQNLLKWHEGHDCEESDTESSEESDVLRPTAHQDASDSYSDSSVCSPESPLVVQSKLPKQADRGSICHECVNTNFQQILEESYDSIATEVSNHHSFETAHSQHHSSPLCENDAPFIPSFNWNHFSSCDHEAFYQNPMCPNCNVTGMSLDEYMERGDSDSTSTCCSPQAERYHRDSSFVQSSPQSCASHPRERYHKINKGSDPNTRLGSGMPKTISGPDLFHKWYTTWYAEVRQKAQELAMTEYINMMSTP